MPVSARSSARRGLFAAPLACLMLVLPLSGCGEDRSNLIPADTADELIGRFDEVQALAASGQCFEALNAADEARKEVESLRGNIDARLKRSLIDGVTQLQVAIGDKDPEECNDSEVTTTEEPAKTDTDASTGSTGTTGTTDSEETTTTDEPAPTTDEDQDSGQQQDQSGQNGTDTPAPDPAPTPTPTPAPAPSTPPGSGGVGPG